MGDNQQTRSLKRWQVSTLITLQLLFAACATSVLVYRSQGRPISSISPGCLRLAVVPDIQYHYLDWPDQLFYLRALCAGMVMSSRYFPCSPSFIHLVEGGLIGFWTKSALQLATLANLARIVYASRSLTIISPTS